MGEALGLDWVEGEGGAPPRPSHQVGFVRLPEVFPGKQWL